MFARGLCRIVSTETRTSARAFSPHLHGPSNLRVLNPAISLALAQRRRPFHSPTNTVHPFNEMAASKEYSLLCLENPLLGMSWDTHTSPSNSSPFPENWKKTITKKDLKLLADFYNSHQTSKPSATMISSPSMTSSPTTPFWLKTSTRASTRSF